MRPSLTSLLSSRANRLCAVLVVTLCIPYTLVAQQNQLANATVLIVRHAEKPESGNSLTPLGFARADKYAEYFRPFKADSEIITIDALYAGADSKGSVRPRLTLEPLSWAMGIPLNTQFPTTDPEALATALRTEPHGRHVLIAWRHSKIPALVKALGADPESLIPNSVWPDAVYDWVLLLHFDAQGRVATQTLIHEPDFHLSSPQPK